MCYTSHGCSVGVAVDIMGCTLEVCGCRVPVISQARHLSNTNIYLFSDKYKKNIFCFYFSEQKYCSQICEEKEGLVTSNRTT